jgi:hypothetical protein
LFAVSANGDELHGEDISMATHTDMIAITDSIMAASDSITATPTKRNIIQKIIDYFGESNVVKPNKKFDISVIGGPSYSEATSVEIAALVSGLYRSSNDSLTPRSDITIYVEGSVTGFYNIGIKGNHYFPHDRMRIEYNANFSHFPLKFWGIGYENGINKANESDYTLLESSFSTRFLWKLPHNIFIGPSADFNYQKATKIERPELWDGQDLRTFCYGLGIAFSYDTRDLSTNASKGCYIGLHQQFFPKFLGNDYAFSKTDIAAMYYHKFWESGIMAFRLHGAATFGSVPWGMLPTLDDGNAVRGYYEKRFRDKNEADFIVELRQHVWRRNGIVIWGGVGTIFQEFNQIRFGTLLPFCGIGYRWEFKNRVNVRVDFGVGKHSKSVNVGINESF